MAAGQYVATPAAHLVSSAATISSIAQLDNALTDLDWYKNGAEAWVRIDLPNSINYQDGIGSQLNSFVYSAEVREARHGCCCAVLLL